MPSSPARDLRIDISHAPHTEVKAESPPSGPGLSPLGLSDEGSDNLSQVEREDTRAWISRFRDVLFTASQGHVIDWTSLITPTVEQEAASVGSGGSAGPSRQVPFIKEEESEAGQSTAPQAAPRSPLLIKTEDLDGLFEDPHIKSEALGSQSDNLHIAGVYFRGALSLLDLCHLHARGAPLPLNSMTTSELIKGLSTALNSIGERGRQGLSMERVSPRRKSLLIGDSVYSRSRALTPKGRPTSRSPSRPRSPQKVHIMHRDGVMVQEFLQSFRDTVASAADWIPEFQSEVGDMASGALNALSESDRGLWPSSPTVPLSPKPASPM